MPAPTSAVLSGPTWNSWPVKYAANAIAATCFTGAGVKLRPDLLVRSRAGRQLTLIDFKTTSSPDIAHFLTTIEKHDYDRQAALYLDVLGATRFLIIGVQKKAPHAVWRVELTATPGLIEQGRKKYFRLLRAQAEQRTRRECWPNNTPLFSQLLPGVAA